MCEARPISTVILKCGPSKIDSHEYPYKSFYLLTLAVDYIYVYGIHNF